MVCAGGKVRYRFGVRSGKGSPMVNTRGFARLGMLAVGLGIGAAVASTPGIASADTPAIDPFSWLAGLDPGDLSAAALPAASPFDLDISVDGFTLLDLGTGATATSGTGDIAIAYGANSSATAEGGFGDYALADSTGSGGATAVAGDDITTGATGNNFDSASASGIDNVAIAGNDPAYGYSDTTGSSFDSASAGGGTAAGPDEALAGFNGSGDSASAVGLDVTSIAGLSSAAPANFDSASVLGNLTTPTYDVAVAGSEIGPSGSSDTAFVIDPGIVGRPQDRNHSRNARRRRLGNVSFGKILPRAEQGRRGRSVLHVWCLRRRCLRGRRQCRRRWVLGADMSLDLLIK